MHRISPFKIRIACAAPNRDSSGGAIWGNLVEDYCGAVTAKLLLGKGIKPM
jgi:hypothetical protein